MGSLDGFGTSDEYYAASSATVTWWARPDVKSLGKIWSISPTIAQDAGDSDVYIRYLEQGKLKLDFSTGAQDSEIVTQ